MMKLSSQLQWLTLSFLTFFLLIDFNVLIVAGGEQKNKLDVLPMCELIMSNLPADEYSNNIYIDSTTTKELVNWTKEIAQACLRGNASSVYSVELSPPE